MRFESKKEKEDLIKSFELKALELEKEKKEDPKTDRNYNCKIIFDTRCEYDEIILEEDEISIKECKGDIYVFFIRQPKLLDSIRILESGKPKENGVPGSIYAPAMLAWDCMIDLKESSPEIQTDRIKLGYMTKMINHIDALLYDQKKS